MEIENQIELEAPEIADEGHIYETVFKVEKLKAKNPQNHQVKKKKVIMPTDSFFSEDFDNSFLVRPTFINWDHQHESPIPENGTEIKDYQIDCVFNESEFHINLQDHLSFSWNDFNKERNFELPLDQEQNTNYDWLQLSREEIQEYIGKPKQKDKDNSEESLNEIKEVRSENSDGKKDSIDNNIDLLELSDSPAKSVTMEQ